jgi:hypothetical protein
MTRYVWCALISVILSRSEGSLFQEREILRCRVPFGRVMTGSFCVPKAIGDNSHQTYDDKTLLLIVSSYHRNHMKMPANSRMSRRLLTASGLIGLLGQIVEGGKELTRLTDE